jgi:hypothetical protein
MFAGIYTRILNQSSLDTVIYAVVGQPSLTFFSGGECFNIGLGHITVPLSATDFTSYGSFYC